MAKYKVWVTVRVKQTNRTVWRSKDIAVMDVVGDRVRAVDVGVGVLTWIAQALRIPMRDVVSRDRAKR